MRNTNINSLLFFLISFFNILSVNAKESRCYGITSNGYIENAIQLPEVGKNFISYNKVAHFLGRTYVHSKVSKIIILSYKKLEILNPNTIFKYAETGLINGGIFKPHKTHQNGLSVDFMVPVKNKMGQSIYFPTNIGNKFGYDIEFDHEGIFENYEIDFEAMASHLKELDQTAKEMGVSLSRVIFDPKLQFKLLKTKNGEYISNFIKFSKKRSWVRHDEHYHVDFNIPCIK